MSSATLEGEKVGRRFSSPTRILARAFRLGRDRWKQKYQSLKQQVVQLKKLASERDVSRNMWRTRCVEATDRAVAAEQRAQDLERQLAERPSAVAGTPAVAPAVEKKRLAK